MIKPTCKKCRQELKEFGGILLSPPDVKNMSEKIHLCVECYKEVEKLINGFT